MMLKAFEKSLQEDFYFLKSAKILVAVSGGVDSVVLTHLCKRSGLDIALAHCNFNLRGKESDKDHDFVQNLADQWNFKIFLHKFDTEAYAEKHKLSIQMAARELRYAWFENLRKREKYNYILTAHHANDDLETFLINLMRGTGLDGLTGIPLQNDFVIRPLLNFSRAEIEKYALENKLSWREDSSNASTKYLRNKIRHEIVPQLQEMNPQVLQNFQKTRYHLEQSSQLVEDYISVIFSRIASENEFGYSFNIKMLKTIPHTKAVMYELFKSFGFSEWNDVVNLIDAQSGKIILSKTHRLIKDREELLLTKIPSEENYQYEIPEGEDLIMLPMGTFRLEKVGKISKAQKNVIFVDKSKLDFPLKIRKWKKGDYFYPFGMGGKKKISSYFKDKKLSLPEKENCWLLCSKNQIIWVIGHRPDERFKIDPDSSEIIKISFTK